MTGGEDFSATLLIWEKPGARAAWCLVSLQPYYSLVTVSECIPWSRHLLLQKSLNHMWMYGNTADNDVLSPGRTPIIYRKVISVIQPPRPFIPHPILSTPHSRSSGHPHSPEPHPRLPSAVHPPPLSPPPTPPPKVILIHRSPYSSAPTTYAEASVGRLAVLGALGKWALVRSSQE